MFSTGHKENQTWPNNSQRLLLNSLNAQLENQSHHSGASRGFPNLICVHQFPCYKRSHWRSQAKRKWDNKGIKSNFTQQSHFRSVKCSIGAEKSGFFFAASVDGGTKGVAVFHLDQSFVTHSLFLRHKWHKYFIRDLLAVFIFGWNWIFWVVHMLHIKSLRPAACLSAAQCEPCEEDNIAPLLWTWQRDLWWPAHYPSSPSSPPHCLLYFVFCFFFLPPPVIFSCKE